MSAREPVDVARLAAWTFRASRAYELVPVDRLSPSERGSLEELRSDPDFYGILRPAERGAASLRRVDVDTALLWTTLTEPGPLPQFARLRLGADASPIVQLVLDGLLEVDAGEGFVSGPAALSTLGRERTAPALDGSPGEVARLSLAALRVAEATGDADEAALAARLYAYNGAPATPELRARFGDAGEVRRALGLDRAPLRELLASKWTEQHPAPPNDVWWSWRHRSPRGGRAPGGATHKLYVSPDPRDLADVLAATVDVLTDHGVTAFKVGNDLRGVLRPDKLVAYLADGARTREVGAALVERLAPYRAQGVPFTAEIGDGAMVSWGLDPEQPRHDPSWAPKESWRLFLVRRLASGLAAARRARDLAMEPWRFALARVEAEGVDVSRWTPAHATEG